MNTMPSTTTRPTPSLDALLQARGRESRDSHPSDGFWDNVFAPRLTRKLMAALSQPRHEGRALTIFGWVTPLVFAAVVAFAIALAWMFSPERAIARWEAGATSRQYVTDALRPEAKPYAIDRGEYRLVGEPASGTANYEFSPAAGRQSDF